MEPLLEISKATAYIRKMYNRICKKKPLLLYNNGVVKYLFIEHWCFDQNTIRRPSDYNDIQILCRIVKKAMHKYPEAAYAISEDIRDIIPVHTRSSPELCWMSGYFEASSDGYPAPAATVVEIDGLELSETDFADRNYLSAKLEMIIDEAQDLLDDLGLEDEDEEEEEDDDEE